MRKFFPILSWLPAYRKEYLKGDLMAGFTVGVMLIPQGMAYAMIAGLPPIYGLYAALIPQVVYAIFGTSRQLAVGPVALDSLLVAAGISTMATVGSEHYIALALLLALISGFLQLAFGLFRFGFLVNFLSKPVISGFTFAAALIIGISQLKYLVGINLAKHDTIFGTVIELFGRVDEVNLPTLALGALGVLLIKFSRKIHKDLPGALVAVVFGIVVVYLLQAQHYGVSIVGVIPEGLPSLTLPHTDWATVKELLPVAMTLAFIAFMEAISVGKSLQAKSKDKYSIDANQELIAIGLGNVLGSLMGSYPTTGGFGRSAVNEQAGARTNLAAIFSAILVATTLLFLTPLFYYLPHTILGAVIMVAVFGLMKVDYPKFLWRNSPQDFIMFLATLLVTLLVGIMEGIGTGVILSLVMMIYRSTKPHYAILGRLPKTKDYRNTSRFNNLETHPDILVFRYDAPLYFANSNHFADTIRKKIIQKEGVKLLVLHFGSISRVDATGYQVLLELLEELEEKQVHVFLSGVIGPVRDFFAKIGFTKKLGKEKFFLDVDTAVSCFLSEDKKRKKKRSEYAVQSNVGDEKKLLKNLRSS